MANQASLFESGRTGPKHRPMTVYLNGEFMPIEEARIPVLDRGFIFGDGVYEVIPVYSRRTFRLAEHLARLNASLSAIRIDNPYSDAHWSDLLARIIAANPWDDQGVYLQVTRGVAPRNHLFPKGLKPTVFIMADPLVTPTRALVESGVAAVVLEDFRWLRCDIKSVSLLGNCLLRTLAADQGATEAILVRDGFLTEASASNVFIVSNGVVLAPPKSCLMLPGITYDVVLELLKANGIAHEVRPVPEEELRTADEVWCTSTSKEVLAITTLDGKPVGHGATAGKPGPAFARIHPLYQQFKAKFMRAQTPAHDQG
jgi:D-alanine transaminase